MTRVTEGSPQSRDRECAAKRASETLDGSREQSDRERAQRTILKCIWAETGKQKE